jgi:F5/8 type C domain/Trehalase
LRNWRAPLAALLAVSMVGGAQAPSGRMLDEHAIAHQRFGADAPWFEGSIPFLETADPLIDQIYYYRWQVLRAHQRDLGARGYITTEFLDDVGWQREPYASLNDATAFHIYEARWLRDRRYADDYIDYMTAGGGNDRHFSESIADAVWARYLVDGDAALATRHLDSLEHVYELWDDHYDFAKKLYWIEPLLDATEYTIASIDASGGQDGFTGGQAFRPSINSYMYANARAISRLAALKGDAAAAALYARRATDLRRAVQDSLWSDRLGHFIDRYKVDNPHVHYWDQIRGRELVGYLPWSVGLPQDRPEYAQAWRHLLSPAELGGPFGLRTNEPSYQYYMRQYRYDKATGGRECQWNGPAWPFQTTQVLTAMANYLNDYTHPSVTASDYMRLLKQYAALHILDGKPDLQEDYDPDTGKPIVGLPRSHHYNHSGFDDLIITGLIGLRPRADGVLEVHPLVPSGPRDPGFLKYFALQDAPYHGHLVSVVFDADGKRYGRGAGLALYVDGRRAATSPGLGRLTVSIAQAPPAPIRRPIDLAASMFETDFPKPTASVNADPASLHQAIDGRVWFFPESSNGWSTAGSADPSSWYAVDFGRPLRLSSAELSFFADDAGFAPPKAYRVQVWRDGAWADVALQTSRAPQPIAGGVNRLSWRPLISSRLRVVFTARPGAALRLVELKVF